MAPKKQQSQPDAFTATLHGCESYTAGTVKFIKGRPQAVSADVAAKLPRAMFSVTSIAAPEPVEEEKAKP